MKMHFAREFLAGLVICMFLCGTANSQEESVIWAAWAEHVRGLLNPSNDAKLDDLTRIVASPIPLHWDDNQYGNYDFCRFADRIPVPGLIYEPSDESVYQQYESFVHSIDVQASASQSAVTDIVRQAESPNYLRSVKSTSGEQHSCPDYSYSPKFAQLESQSTSITWELGRDQQSTIQSRTHVKIRFGPFVHSSVSSGRLKVGPEDIVKISIRYKLARVVIQPGPWFSGTLIELFNKGPFKADSAMTKSKFFGPDGNFPYLPREAIVAMRAKVTLTLSFAAFESLRRDFQANQSIDIGPFHFGAEGQESTISLQESAKTLTLESSSQTPFLIAVVNEAVGRK